MKEENSSVPTNYEATVADEVGAVRMGKPHLVILGAGASRAACPNGDRNGKCLPLMADFSTATGCADMFRNWGIDPAANLEDIYTDLFERQEADKLSLLQQTIENYFGNLQIPDHPTIYDYLILSLREADVVATFNWDPLLIQAYRRNNIGLGLPKLLFLHGNVATGYCSEHKFVGLAGGDCKHCRNPLTRTPLLYPVRHKNYASNPAITWDWNFLKQILNDCFMLTIFGYSGPKTDAEAMSAMGQAWGDPTGRNMEQTAFITLQSEEELIEAWSGFIHSHHYEVHSSFYDSFIANHPRRTGEAYIHQFLEAKFINDNPIPRDLDLPELWKWFQQFKEAEDAATV